LGAEASGIGTGGSTASGAATNSGARTGSGAAMNSGAAATSASTESGSTADREREIATGREAAQPSRGSSISASRGRGGLSAFGDPLSVLQQMAEDMDRLFDHFGFGGLIQNPQRSLGSSGGGSQRQLARSGPQSEIWAPQMEVFRRGNDLVVRADLPGLRREDVQVDIENDVLAISGERRQESEENREGFYRSERSYGSFHRAIPLPENVDPSKINASFRDGVLEITIPTPNEQQRRKTRIDVK
jgi:HSP20 family protein